MPHNTFKLIRPNTFKLIRPDADPPDLGTHEIIIEGLPVLLDLWSVSEWNNPPHWTQSEAHTAEGGIGVRARVRFIDYGNEAST